MAKNYNTGGFYELLTRDTIFYESFVFLIIALPILILSLYLTRFAPKNKNTKTYIKTSLFLLIISLILINIAIIYCDIYAIFYGGWQWGESAIIWFLTAVPSSVMFLLGALILGYGFIRNEITEPGVQE